MTEINCPFNKPKYEPMFWDNLKVDDKKITNCYSYAFNYVDKNDYTLSYYTFLSNPDRFRSRRSTQCPIRSQIKTAFFVMIQKKLALRTHLDRVFRAFVGWVVRLVVRVVA